MRILLGMIAGLVLLTGCGQQHIAGAKMEMMPAVSARPMGRAMPMPKVFTTERYAHIEENRFKDTRTSPLSTVSIDVDTASYTNVKRFIGENRMPPRGAVRIEEMINAFAYDYPRPKDGADDPFALTTELAPAPWNRDHQLLLVGLQAKTLPKSALPRSNFVALVDVSGSMRGQMKLVRQMLTLLAGQLDDRDRFSIVTYAGAVQSLLAPTSGDKRSRILEAIHMLQSGGSTAGGAGIEFAYKAAKDGFIKGGNNRIILITDGDFNIGRTSTAQITEIVKREKRHGIFLSVVGVGRGNYNDEMMETMSNHGDGNYAYVSDVMDAERFFSRAFVGNMYTLGKDVKFQIEFNPARVSAYRLIGYENRVLAAEDFADDKKDAGEIGVGHRVTALWELQTARHTTAAVPLKYQKMALNPSDELATLKLRYKPRDANASRLMTQVIPDKADASANLTFASAVAGFGMLLSDSQYKGELTYARVIELAKTAKGADDDGARAEFIRLVEKAALMQKLSAEHPEGE